METWPSQGEARGKLCVAGIGGTTVESSDVRDEQNQRFIYKAQRFIAEKIRLCA